VKLARLSAAKKSLFIKYLLDEPMNWLKISVGVFFDELASFRAVKAE